MFATIENAMIARIKGSYLGQHVKTVADRQKAEAELAKGQITAALPAIYVAYMGGPDARVGRHYKHTARFSVAVITQSLYSQTAAKEKTNVGAYAILKALRALLAGHTLGLSDRIDPLIPEGIFPQEPEPDSNLAQLGISIFTANFSTAYIVDAVNADGSARGAANEDEIERTLVEIIATYAVEPGGDFAHPAATDNIQP